MGLGGPNHAEPCVLWIGSSGLGELWKGNQIGEGPEKDHLSQREKKGLEASGHRWWQGGQGKAIA